jgi:hypothetical protein
VGSGGLYGYFADSVLAAVECGDGDAAEWGAGQHDGYAAGVRGGFRGIVYGDGKCCRCGEEFFGHKRDGSERHAGWGVDGGGV